MMQRFITVAIAILLATALSFRVTNVARPQHQRQKLQPLMSSSPNTQPQTKLQRPALWGDRVEYLDLSASKIDDSDNQVVTRTMPLFCLGRPVYPLCDSSLQVFEMKYRTMMFDCAKDDDTFGYIHSDSRSGGIAKYGVSCKIRDRILLEDGRQIISFDGVERFRVRKILKTLPYVLAEVEIAPDDAPSNEEEAKTLEFELYATLKYYFRLLKILKQETPEKKQKILLIPSIKKSRPSVPQLDETKRRSEFTFAVANLIQTERAQESQLLLQTRDVVKRLEAEKMIIEQAVQAVEKQMSSLDFITADMQECVRAQCFSREDDESDLLPPDVVQTEQEEEKDMWDMSNIQ
jgi:ATP-dependent Lon protease